MPTMRTGWMTRTGIVVSGGFALGAAVLMVACASPRADSMQDAQAVVGGASAATPKASERVACAAPEVAVFSCRLEGAGERIALCADESSNRDIVYFMRGVDGHAPQIHPVTRRGAGLFFATRVFSTGATGVRTYSFEQAGRRRVIYSVSSTGVEKQGLFTMDIDGIKPEREERCAAGTVQDPGWELAEGWARDPLIERHGLPHF